MIHLPGHHAHTADPNGHSPLPFPAQPPNLSGMDSWTATVVEHHRLRRDVAVIRLIGEFVPFTAGQSVEVQVPQFPSQRRRFSPALPPSLDGKLEFHVRTVPGGWCSGAIVADTTPGDTWVMRAPQGIFRIDPAGDDIVMIAGGTGLAPMRAQLLHLARYDKPPKTTLFVGGSCPRDLYAADMLTLMAADFPWLTVIPVVEDPDDPDWADEWYERTRVPVGFRAQQLLHGTLADIVATYGAFSRHQILVCGSAAMVQATMQELIDAGTPADRIQFEAG